MSAVSNFQLADSHQSKQGTDNDTKKNGDCTEQEGVSGADQEKVPVLFQQSAYVIDNIQGDFLPVKTLIRLLRCREILQARLLQLSIPGTGPVR